MEGEPERQLTEQEREREERRREREEQRLERWERRRSDPIGPVFGALVLIWMGVLLFVTQNPEMFRLPISIRWDNVWLIFLAGLGALLILQALLRAVLSYRHGVVGSLVWGIVLLIIGLAGVFPGAGLDKLWPLAIIALGVGLLATNILRR
jgi:hypothetical protein